MKIGASLIFSTETLSYIWNLKIKKNKKIPFYSWWRHLLCNFSKNAVNSYFWFFKIFLLCEMIVNRKTTLCNPQKTLQFSIQGKKYDMVIFMAELFAKIFYFWKNKFKKFLNFYQTIWKMKPKSSSIWLFLWDFVKDLCKT